LQLISSVLQNSLPQYTAASADAIRDITWRYAGIVRNAIGLKTGLDLLSNIAEARPTGNLLTVARMIHTSALAREESRGAHYRDDFPAPSASKLHSYITKNKSVVLR